MAHQYRILSSALVILSFAACCAATPSTQPTTQPAAAAQPSNPEDLTALSINDLMNISVTSVNKQTQRIADAPAAVTVITQDDIQRSGLHEIPEILRLAPGTFVQKGNQLTGWSVATRGFAELFSNKLLVLEDGRTLYTPFFSGTYWDTVDYNIADLDRIEVIRGPGASLWGSNAVNGVINITTKGAQDTQGVLIDGRAGADTSDVAVRYGGKIDDDTYYRIYAKGREFANDPGANDASDDSRAGFRLDRLASDRDTITLQSDFSYGTINNDSVPGTPTPIPDYQHDYRSTAYGLARLTHTDSDTDGYTAQFYYDRFGQRDPFVTYRLNTYDLDFQDRFALNKQNELIWGFGGRAQGDRVNTFFLPSPLVQPDNRETYQASGFIQDTMTLVPDRWTLFAGSKFEYDTTSPINIEPSVRLLWTPSSEESVWGSFSRALRTPARWEEDSNFFEPVPAATPTFVEVLGHRVNAENLLAYESGYRREITKDFSVDVATYIDDYSRLITIKPLPTVVEGGTTIMPQQWINGQTAQDYGGELSANWHVTRDWRLAGSYSFLEAFVQHDSDISPEQTGVIQRSFPKNMFQFHSYYDLTRNLQFNASMYYASRIGPSGVPVSVGAGPGNPDTQRVDFNVAWQPKPGLTMSVGVQNAFDPQHYESTTGEGSTAEVRRAVYGQMTLEF